MSALFRLRSTPSFRRDPIDLSVFRGTCWSNSTKLLNTAIIGAIVDIVTSSSGDIEAGLSR
jgi:hypothetical protein